MYWNQAVKKVAYWTLPPGIQALVRPHQTRTRLSSIEVELLERNRDLRDRHRGERCFILATGPSIKKQDLRLLKDETCIAVSNFFVHADFAIVSPRYYCVAPYHQPITEEAWQSWMTELDSGTGDAVMFFELGDRERNRRNELFADRQVHYLKFGESLDTVVASGIDITRGVPGPQSVTIMALLIALYMGFQRIYLLGCDHDWILHLNQSTHFYDEKKHALNRKSYNEWSGNDLESYCRDYVRLWQQYKAVQRAANDLSIRVYNATAGGLLDVFERVDYSSLFEEDHAVQS